MFMKATRRLRSLFPAGSRKVKLGLTSGDSLTVRPPRGHGGPETRRFVFALHKSGSVLLNRIVEDLAAEGGRPVFNLPELLFRKGIPFKDLEKVPADLFLPGGVVYAGFRNLPKDPCRIGLEKGGKVVLMVRDPRDILVSLYFSMKKSHSVPKSGSSREKLLQIRERVEAVTLEQFVESSCRRLRKRLRKYRNGLVLSETAETRVFRYEDVIFEKARWVADLAEFLEIEVSPERAEEIAARHDRRPEREDPSAHVRRVAPGDYREKLSDETIEMLNRELGEVSGYFGYDLR